MSFPEQIENLRAAIIAHWGMEALDTFGSNLVSRPFRPQELRVFLATTSAFFREIPGGILALGLRVMDDWMSRDRFGAVSKGARVLYSAVDEVGLHQMDNGIQATHHELFRNMARHWGISEADLVNPHSVLEAGEQLAQLTAEFYRRRPIPDALGFHVASELTSEREFVLCYRGFRAFPETYRLDDGDAHALEFYRLHTVVEPMHGATAIESIRPYAQLDTAVFDFVTRGAMAFMESYGRLFNSFNDAFYLHK